MTGGPLRRNLPRMRRGLWALIGTTALLMAGCGGEDVPKAEPPPSPSKVSTDTCAPIFDEARAIAADMSAKGLAQKIRDLNALADQAAAECPLDRANDLEAAVEAVERAEVDLGVCVAVRGCDLRERAGAYGDAVEQLRRAVAG